MDEFDLIKRYFSARTITNEGVATGIGDDAAIFDVPPGQQLVVTTDTLVEGVHFLADTDAESVGHKLAAVNLSDIAAMGACPEWALLTLTLPQVDPVWLEGFSNGLLGLLAVHEVALAGGDTTRGPLSVGLQLMGTVPNGEALHREGARPGDVICVSGAIGGAALALALQQGRAEAAGIESSALLRCLNRPVPRVKLGQGLRGIATACIDISDGLVADSGHIAESSSVGIEIDMEAVPLADGYSIYLAAGGDPGLALGGGDDYELCFTLPESRLPEAILLGSSLGIPIQPIGRVTEGRGVVVLQVNDEPYESKSSGYKHFRESS